MSSYAPVSTSEPIELSDVNIRRDEQPEPQLESDADAGAEYRPLTKRAIYSSHRIEARTPRGDGEDDAAYKRRIHAKHINAIVHSIGWVLAALAIIYYTDIWNVIRYDARVNR